MKSDCDPDHCENRLMNTDNLNLLPENTVILNGGSLLTLRHLLTPPSLTTVIREPQDAAHLYEILGSEYPPEHPIELLCGSKRTERTLKDLASDPDILKNADHLLIPPLPEQNSFENFQNTVAILRGPNGCPWDKKQTHQSLRDDFLQEVYELLDGLDRADLNAVTEELGDVLLHVVLQTQIGIDGGEFNMGNVISHINDKIIYRHQHVFGNPEDISADQVLLRWEQIKKKERAKQNRKGGLLDGINRAMPALSMAFSYQKRAGKAGLEQLYSPGAGKALLERFLKTEDEAEKETAFGELLFALVSLARQAGIDPETALRTANLKYYDRVRFVEQRAAEAGKDLFTMSPEEKERILSEYGSEK